MTTPREDIAAMLRDGATCQQIITTLHVSTSTVTATRRALDIPLPPGRPAGRPAKPPREDIAELLRAGATYRQIQKQLGVTPNQISATRTALNIPVPARNPARITPERENAITLMIKNGASDAQIMRELSAGKSTLRRIRQTTGIPTRGRATWRQANRQTPDRPN